MKARRLRMMGIAAALALAAAASACSLGAIHREDCASDDQCASAFGAGSRCEQGYCSEPKGQTGCQKTGADGRSCFGCAPKTTPEFENACSDATCAPFDDAARLTKLTADGGLPPLP